MASNSVNVLTPFDDAEQELLKQVDLAIRSEIEHLKEEMNSASLKGEQLEVDVETLALSRFFKAYGILYNRAVDAGWVSDIMVKL